MKPTQTEQGKSPVHLHRHVTKILCGRYLQQAFAGGKKKKIPTSQFWSGAYAAVPNYHTLSRLKQHERVIPPC